MKIPQIILLGALLAASGCAQDFADVEYLCCDWGPAMTLSTKTNQPPVFSETEEEVYFIKQVGRFTRKKSIVPHLLNSHGYVDTGHGINIYLCKMKADGSDLQLIVPPAIGPVANNPSWGPDGDWIIIAWNGRIAKCDKNGQSIVYLTPEGQHNSRPRVSPDGTKIIYLHLGDAKTGGLYVMNIDGSDAHLVPPDPNDQYKRPHDGDYPAWSPDGKKVLLIGHGVIDIESGKRLFYRLPIYNGEQASCGWAHWGKSGIVGYNVSGLSFTDTDFKTLLRLA